MWARQSGLELRFGHAANLASPIGKFQDSHARFVARVWFFGAVGKFAENRGVPLLPRPSRNEEGVGWVWPLQRPFPLLIAMSFPIRLTRAHMQSMSRSSRGLLMCHQMPELDRWLRFNRLGTKSRPTANVQVTCRQLRVPLRRG
jgi:hypothetical protein